MITKIFINMDKRILELFLVEVTAPLFALITVLIPLLLMNLMSDYVETKKEKCAIKRDQAKILIESNSNYKITDINEERTILEISK